MKAKDVVKATKEYERLQSLIDNIEQALKDLTKTTKIGGVTVLGSCILSGYVVTPDVTDGSQIRTIDISLNSFVSELIRDDMRGLLSKHLFELKEKQESLEV